MKKDNKPAQLKRRFLWGLTMIVVILGIGLLVQRAEAQGRAKTSPYVLGEAGSLYLDVFGFDPFAPVSTPTRSLFNDESTIEAAATMRPRIRIPFKPPLRSPFAP